MRKLATLKQFAFFNASRNLKFFSEMAQSRSQKKLLQFLESSNAFDPDKTWWCLNPAILKSPQYNVLICDLTHNIFCNKFLFQNQVPIFYLYGKVQGGCSDEQ